MPQGGTATSLPPHFVQRAVEGLRYIISGITPETWFGPLQPLPPQAPPDVGGRQLDYPFGYNLAIAPRSDEPISFAQLRSLADGFDLLRTVIETRKDQVERLRWTIRCSDPGDGKPRNRDDDPRIAEIEAFFRLPDGVHFWSTWLRQLLEDLFVVDAPTLYLRRNRGGKLSALEIVDGTTIKRLIDADGRTPAPPDPAYQQVLHGLPAADFTTSELIYRPRNLRPHKLYGYSPVEQIVMTVNIALRRQLHQLAYYTEGNVPEALIGTPESWSPQQIKEFQQYWDALLEGNLAQRRHAKFVPGGVAKTFIPTRDAELKGAYDEWLARIVCFAFSISPQGFLAQMNRATAETAQQTAISEGLAPIQNWVKQLVDYLLITEFDAPDLEFCWRDEREVDPQQAASVAQIYVAHGIKTVNEARSDLGLDPVMGGDVPLVFTGSGPVPLAKAAGAPLAKYIPDQPRDERGRWTNAGGDAPVPIAANDDGTMSDAGGILPGQVAAGGEEDETRREEETSDTAAPVRRELFSGYQTKLRAIDPANRQAASLATPDWVPRDEDVRDVKDALDEAIRNVAANAAQHSYDEHVVARQEFPEIGSQVELQLLAQNVIKNNPPQLASRGRTLFYGSSSNTLVIVNTRDPEKSTVYRPPKGAAAVRSILRDK
jgi:hypothetical protein